MNDRYMRIMTSHIRSNDIYTLLPTVGFIDELRNYSKQEHAKVVYLKCLQNGKVAIAKRIKIKYSIANRYDDRVIALSFALLAANGG